MSTEERTASRTAVGVALLRAMHELYDDSPKVLNDPIISLLLDEGVLRRAQANLEWHAHPRTTALRSHVVLRSRYAEDCLHEAVTDGVRQYVILGSGLDTFAYRQPAWASTVRIFEVDHAASQRAKLERLRLGPPALFRAAVPGIRGQDHVDLVERVYVCIQGTRPDSAIPRDREAWRLP